MDSNIIIYVLLAIIALFVLSMFLREENFAYAKPKVKVTPKATRQCLLTNRCLRYDSKMKCIGGFEPVFGPCK
jgi:hypothetical protein